VSLPRIVHLVDDTTAGGVMRVLDHILTAPEMARTAQHSLIGIDRGRVSLGPIEADVIVSHLSVSWRGAPMVAALRARHPRTPLVHVEHSYTEAFVAANVVHKRRFAALLRLTYRLFDRVVAVSHAQGQWLVRSGAVRARALSIIPSCVDLSAFRALDRTATPARIIGAIGRLDRQKGFDTLITAFRSANLPSLQLHIYGDGAERGTLQALAGDDPRIKFMGFSREPVAAMAAVDVVAMPSNWEAYGLVAIEALAAGRGLLVNGIDGLIDHIPNGARSVADNSPEAWRTALEEISWSGAAMDGAPIRSGPSLETAFSDNWHNLLSGLVVGRSNSASHRKQEGAGLT
jgi:glycosyltransferase involved in cell wall biosynthesis